MGQRAVPNGYTCVGVRGENKNEVISKQTHRSFKTEGPAGVTDRDCEAELAREMDLKGGGGEAEAGLGSETGLSLRFREEDSGISGMSGMSSTDEFQVQVTPRSAWYRSRSPKRHGVFAILQASQQPFGTGCWHLIFLTRLWGGVSRDNEKGLDEHTMNRMQ